MKKLIVFAAAALLVMASCNSSKKGAWTDDDKEKARTSLKEGGIDDAKVQDCIIGSLEKEYESFADADSREGGEEKENKLVSLMTDCMK